MQHTPPAQTTPKFSIWICSLWLELSPEHFVILRLLIGGNPAGGGQPCLRATRDRPATLACPSKEPVLCACVGSQHQPAPSRSGGGGHWKIYPLTVAAKARFGPCRASLWPGSAEHMARWQLDVACDLYTAHLCLVGLVLAVALIVFTYC